MFIGLGMPIPDLSNKPGPGRPGWGPIGSYDFQFEVAGSNPVIIKANAASNTGSFRISWPNGSIVEYSGNNASITAPDATEGIVSINNEELDTTYMDEFAVVGNKTAVTKVISWGNNNWSNMAIAFKDCTNLTELPSASNIFKAGSASLSQFIHGCTSLTELDMTGWDLSSGTGTNLYYFAFNCTNLQKVVFKNKDVKLSTSTPRIFQAVGTNVSAGCEFDMEGLNFTGSCNDMNTWFITARAKVGSNFSNWRFNQSVTNLSLVSLFNQLKFVDTSAVLNMSGWTDCNAVNLSSMFSGAGGATTSTPINAINITGLRTNDTTTMYRMFRSARMSRIIGLNDLVSNSLTGTGVVEMFNYCDRLILKDPSVTPTENLSNSFGSNWSITSVANMFDRLNEQGNTYSEYSYPPNLTGFNLSNVTNYAGFAIYNDLSAPYDLSSVTFPTSAISLQGSFSSQVFTPTSDFTFDFTNVTINVSNFQQTFQNNQCNRYKFGSNVNFSNNTTFQETFRYAGMPPILNNGDPSYRQIRVEFPTNANFGSVTTMSGMFSGQYGGYSNQVPFTNCQADNFIRIIYGTAFSNNLTVDLLNSQVTEAPSVVQSKLQELTTGAGGWSIQVNSTDATLPFAYASYAVDPTGITTISPTTTPPAGSVFTATNSLSINSSTGVITINTFRGSSTIRCTYPDGCYNEVVMLIQVPFIMRTVIPGLVGSTTYLDMEVKPQMSAGECFIDWGDSSSETLTGNTTHTYAAAGTYDIKIFDSPSGSKFENFTGYFPTYAGLNGGNAAQPSTYNIDIIKWGEIQWKNHTGASGLGWFGTNQNTRSYIELAAAATDAPDLSQVTSLQGMFSTGGGGGGWHAIMRFTDPNNSLTSWNTSTITNMNGIWRGKVNNSSANLDLSAWDVSNVQDFSNLFSSSHYNSQALFGTVNLSNWNTQNATNMSAMFYRMSATAVTGIGNLKTSLVENISEMFSYANTGVIAQSGETLKTKMVDGSLRWDVNNVTNFYRVFNHSYSLSAANFPDNWNITSDNSKTVNMASMFVGTGGGLSNITDLNAIATKTENETWYGGTSYTSWNMSRVSSLNQFAYSAGGGPISRNYNIASWQISSVLTDMFYMFGGKSGGNGSIWQQDVGHWDVSGLDDGPSKISYWLSARNGTSPPNIGRTIYDSILDVTDGWGSQTGTAGFPTTITMQNGTSQYNPGITVEGTTNGAGTSTTIYDSTKNFTTEGTNGNIAVGSILYNKDTNQYGYVTAFSGYTVTTSQAIWGSSGVNYRVENSNAAKGKIALINAGWFVNDGGAYIPPVTPLQLQFTVAPNTQTQIDITGVYGGASTYSFSVNWGDGLTETVTGSNNSTISHTYNDGNNNNVTNPTVSIGSNADLLAFSGMAMNTSSSKTLLIDVPQWGSQTLTRVVNMFSGCSNLNSLSATNAPNITAGNWTGMFASTGTLGNANLNYLNTSGVSTTSSLFAGSQFNGNISEWDVSSVQTATSMFSSSVFTGDLTSWDVTSISLSNNMFNSGASNPNITGWDMASASNQYFWAWGNTAFNPGPFLIGHTNTNQNWKYMNNQSAWTTNNWTDFLVLNANAANARSPKTPIGADFTSNSTGYRTVDTTRTYSGTGFQNAGRAISFLTADVTISGGSSAINGIYGYNYTTQKWVRDGDAEKTIEWNAEESVWEVLSAGVSQHVGSGGTQGNGPESSTSWTGGITVVDSSLGWTLYTSIIS